MNSIRNSIPAAEIVAQRKAQIFNARYQIGDAVMHIRAPGAEPIWDRVYSRATVVAGRSVVSIAGLPTLVETDQLYPPPIDLAPPPPPDRASWMDTPSWALALAFVLGFAMAVLLTATTSAAHSAPPEHIVIDCDEPGEMPANGRGPVPNPAPAAATERRLA